MATHWHHCSNAQSCAAWTDVKNNHFCRSSLKFWFNVDAWLLISELEGLDVGGGCLRALRRDDKLKISYMRLFPQGGLVCSALTECSRQSALTDASEGTFCGNELLIPEGRAGEIRLIWTLLLCLMFVMQSYSVAATQTWKNRWLWIMGPLLSACPRTPLIVLSKALQRSPGLHQAGRNNCLSLFTFRLEPLEYRQSANLAFCLFIINVKYALKSQDHSISGCPVRHPQIVFLNLIYFVTFNEGNVAHVFTKLNQRIKETSKQASFPLW